MDIKIQSALIAAAISLLASLVTLIVSRRQIKAQKENIEKEVSSTFVQSAYEMRLKHYPKAFKITANAGRVYDLSIDEVIKLHAEIAEELRDWRNSEAFLVISDFALEKLQELEKELKKHPSEPRKHYSHEQKQRMWKKRQNFRYSLRKDLGLYSDTKDETRLS